MLHSTLHAAAYALDPEYQDHATHTIGEVTEGFIHVFERLLPAKEASTAVLQHSVFRNKEGLFGKQLVRDSAQDYPAHVWWEQFGAQVPELQRVAIRGALALTSSAASGERN
jgi:hypothetical protein